MADKLMYITIDYIDYIFTLLQIKTLITNQSKFTEVPEIVKQTK